MAGRVKLLRLAALWLMLCMGIFGCAGGMFGISITEKIPESWQTEIRELVRQQESAVISGSLERYMQTIEDRDAVYWQEQRHWFTDAAAFVKERKYRRSVSAFLERRANDEVVALIEQRAEEGGKARRVRVPICFRRTPAGWKDADLPFLETRSPHTIVKVTHQRLLPFARELQGMADQVQKRLASLYGWKPRQPVAVKLYGKKDWFLQSVKWSLPDWAGGWNEYGESIKLLVEANADISDRYKTYYHSAIIHEMVHKMLGELTNDNAAYWLQEGLAEQTSARMDRIPENDALPVIPRSELWSWPKLASVQLEQLTAEEAPQYYHQSRLIVEFLLERYGYQPLREAFRLLRQQPYIPASTAEKLQEVNRRTVRALEQALGKPFQQLAEEWWIWATGQ